MESLANIVPKIAGAYGLKEEMSSSFVLEKTKQIIEKYFGKKGVMNLQPQKVVFNVVFIKATNSAWSQELQFQKHNLIEELNKINMKTVFDVRVML